MNRVTLSLFFILNWIICVLLYESLQSLLPRWSLMGSVDCDLTTYCRYQRFSSLQYLTFSHNTVATMYRLVMNTYKKTAASNEIVIYQYFKLFFNKFILLSLSIVLNSQYACSWSFKSMLYEYIRELLFYC